MGPFNKIKNFLRHAATILKKENEYLFFVLVMHLPQAAVLTPGWWSLSMPGW